MKPRTTAVLLLVAAALAAFVYLYEIRGGARREEAAEQAKRLFPDLEASDVASVALTTTDDRQVRVERVDGGWKLVEPLEFPGDEVALDGMASALTEMSSENSFEDPQPPEVYGLGESARVVRFRAGQTDHELRVGKKTPVGGNTYVGVGGDARVFTVLTFRVNALQRSLADLRERRLLRFDRESIQRIEASWPDGAVTLEKRDDGWFLVAPLETRADATTVETLLSDLSFLRAEGFVDDPPADARFGFERPAFRALLSAPAPREGEEPLRFELAVGAAWDDQGRVARGAGGALYTIPEERLEELPRRVVAYRFKELASFPSGDAQRVEIAFHEPGGEVHTLEAERGEEGWATRPERLAEGMPARLLAELGRLRAEDIAAESMGAQELAGVGLSPPRVIFRVFGAAEDGEAPKLAEVHVGHAKAGRGIFARVPERATVYLLDEELAETLPLGLEALRNRFLAPPSEAEGEPEAEVPAPEAAEQPGGGLDE